MKFKLSQPQAIYELGQRGNQEDSIYPPLGQATADDRLFIVCDGMGGHEHGEVASKVVVETISRYIKINCPPDSTFTDQMLTQALDAAYSQLNLQDRDETRTMGTTLTLLYFHRHGATVAHIGDSRIYHLRPGTGEILYISRDHSLVMDLYQAGEITFDEMHTHPKKNVITRAMQPGSQNRVRADVAHITDIKPGDYFYLCSDGMLEQMSDAQLLQLVSSPRFDEAKREELIKATELNRDNHSAYLIHVEQVELQPGDENLCGDEASTSCNAVNIYRRHENAGDVQENAGDVVVVDPAPDPAPPGPKDGKNQLVKRLKQLLIPLLILAILAFVCFAYYAVKDKEETRTTTTEQQTEDTEDRDDSVDGNSTSAKIADEQRNPSTENERATSQGTTHQTPPEEDHPKPATGSQHGEQRGGKGKDEGEIVDPQKIYETKRKESKKEKNRGDKQGSKNPVAEPNNENPQSELEEI